MLKTNNTMILLEFTANTVSSHVTNNNVTPDSLPEFINKVHASLAAATAGEQKFDESPRHPAVPIKCLVSNDYLICL